MQSESDAFVPWDGVTYEKDFYDVLLPSGEIVPNCWPNAGKLNETRSPFRQFLLSDRVCARLSLNPPYPNRS